MRRLRLGMCQVNVTVGDFAGNVAKILAGMAQAKAQGVDVLTFPELALCGYPPEDLLFRPRFIEENRRALGRVIEASAGLTVMLGFVHAEADIYDAAAVIHDGRLVDVYHKIYLPNYGVFDENRYFRAGNVCPVYTIAGVNIGLNICEDAWYEVGPATVQSSAGAEVIINISASPFHFRKRDSRERMLATRAADNVVIFAYNNLVGGQDELVFDGSSVVFDEKGQVLARGKPFAEDLLIVDLDVESVFRGRLHDPRWRKGPQPWETHGWRQTHVTVSEASLIADRPALPPPPRPEIDYPAEVYDALVLGTGDYVRKNGFQQVVIGLSGGIDSSLVATIATDALGLANVVGVSMPSPYSSPGSKDDARTLADNLGIRLMTVPIDKAFQAYLETLADSFAGQKVDSTEENIQARIRGNIVMALSNKFGYLVLSTGNKSEMATGYTTLYGDMAGGFAVIKDVPKTMVYELARYRNGLAGRDLIPAPILTKAPSAELRPGQKTTESLYPFDILDPILTAYVEEDKSIEQIVGMGFDLEVVQRVARFVDRSEYKRRQAPPGVKITPRAFGRDRRLPITNRFKEW